MKKVKILILASNPIDTGRLQIDLEVKMIQDAILKSKYRDYIEIIPKLAVTINDFRNALLSEKPDIVHFTGHGASGLPGEFIENSRDINLPQTELEIQQAGCLVLESNSGGHQLLKPKAVANLVKMYKDSIKCIVLAACHSQYQAELFSEHVNYAIGMKKAVLDKSAIAFSTAFYEAIGNAETFPFAFEFASNNIDLNGLEGSDIPQLETNKNLKKHKAIINAKKIKKKKNKEKNGGNTIKIKGDNNKTYQNIKTKGDINF